MSRFILHKKGKEQEWLKYLALGMACVVIAAVSGFLVHSIGTAGAKSREIVEIHTLEELEHYLLDRESEEYNLNGRYRLAEDLDGSLLEESIGRNMEPFTGEFDGNGYVISGLERPLFGVMERAEVRNLFLSGAEVIHPFTYYDGERYVDGYGALAAYAVDTVIRSCGMGGEILTASPAEAEYLLEKASPSDADEERGPGVEGPGNAGDQEWKEESSEIEAGPGVETKGQEVTETGVQAEENGEGSSADGNVIESQEEEAGPGVSQGSGSSSEMDGETGGTALESGTPSVSETAGGSVAETGGTGSSTSKPESGTPESGTGNSGSGTLETETGSNGSGTAKPGTGSGESETSESGTGSGGSGTAEPGTGSGGSGTSESGTGNIESGALEPENGSGGGSGTPGTEEGNLENGSPELAETVGYRANDRQQLMLKVSAVVDSDAESILTASPSDAEPADADASEATPSNAEEATEPGNPGTGTGEEVSGEGETEVEYIGNPDGDIYILVTAQQVAAGGLVAQTAGKTLIADCYALATIESALETVDTYAGGLAGILGEESRTENSYAVGLVDSDDVAGGFSAVNEGQITNCYCAMTIGEAGRSRGGFTVLGEGSLEGCVYDRQLSCIRDVEEEEFKPGLTALNTNQMTGTESAVPGNWYLAEQAYPQLEAFAQSEHVTVMSYSKASAIALELPEGTMLADIMGEQEILLPSAIDGEEIQWDAAGEVAIDENNQVRIGPGVTFSSRDVPRVEMALAGEGAESEADDELKADVTKPETDEIEVETDSTEVETDAPETENALETENREEIPESGTDNIENSKTVQLKATVGPATRNFALGVRAVTLTDTPPESWEDVGKELYTSGYTMAGNGSSSNPYQIGTAEEFAIYAYIINYVSGGAWGKLTADIDLFGASYVNVPEAEATIENIHNALRWVPIGKNTSQFRGATFDGAGHKVWNLRMDESANPAALSEGSGLFGWVHSGTVRNLGVASGFVRGNSRCGGVVGRAEQAVTISNCWNNATVIGSGTIGGILGYSLWKNTYIMNCYNTGSVTGTSNVGGILGQRYSGNGGNITITNCYNWGAIDGNSNIGGIVGLQQLSGGSSNIANCYSTGAVTGDSNLGAVSGSNNSATKNCYYDKETSLVPDAVAKPVSTAGMKSWAAAYALNGSKVGTPWTYDVNGVDYPTFGTLPAAESWEAVGQGCLYGLIGSSLTGDGDADVRYCIESPEHLAAFQVEVQSGKGSSDAILLSDIDLTGTSYGGSSGEPLRWLPIGDKTTVYTGDFNGNGNVISHMRVVEDGYAGLFGCAGGGAHIRKLGLDGTCSVTANSAGGMAEEGTAAFVGAVASVAGEDTQIIIESCYNRASVTGKGSGTGAFVGTDTGTIPGKQRITACYNAGSITTTNGTARVIAGSFENGTDTTVGGIYNCYWDKETSGAVTVAGGSRVRLKDNESYTTSEMQSEAMAGRMNLASAASFWQYAADINQGYPSFGAMPVESWEDVALTATAPSPENTGSMGTAGTSGNPYQITTPSELAWFAWVTSSSKEKAGLCAELKADINLFGGEYTGKSYDSGDADILTQALAWKSIGREYDGYRYTGTFRGNGNTVSFMRADRKGAAGMFGTLGTGAVIENVKLADSLVEVQERERHAGGITGSILGDNVVITGCENKGTLSSPGAYVGGMAGYIAGTGTEIKGCWNSGTVKGTAGNYIGGMVGAIAADTVIDGCYNVAGSAVTGTLGASTGGILGGAVTGTLALRNCYNQGAVSGGAAVGGIAGTLSLPAQNVAGCYNAGAVTGTLSVGAVVGTGGSSDSVTYCFYDKNKSLPAVDAYAKGVETAAFASWGAAFGLNGERLAQESSSYVSWTYVAGSGAAYPEYGTLPDADSWETVGRGLADGFIAMQTPSGSPLELGTAEQLAWFAEQINDGKMTADTSAVLTADLDLSGGRYVSSGKLPWMPIGKDSAHSYRGTFSGSGSRVVEVGGLYISAADTAGLFGNVGAGGKVTGIGVTTISITGDKAGGIAGAVSGGAEISRCFNRGGVVSGASYAGGIAGQLAGNAVVKNCYALEAAVTGTGGSSCAGGIAGDGSGGVIRNSYQACLGTNRITAGGTAGSISGKTGAGEISQCYSDASLADSGKITLFDTSSDEMRQKQTDGLNTFDGTEYKGTDRVWFTSLADEDTKGMPTLDAPEMMTVEVDLAGVTESGGVLSGAEGSWSGGTLPPSHVLLRGIHQEASGSSQPAFSLTSKGDVTAGFHTYGTDNAHQNLAVEAGGIDLADCTRSLTAPDRTLDSVSPLKLYCGASYIYPYQRALLLDLAVKSGDGADRVIKRYEVRIEIKEMVRNTLDITITNNADIVLKPGMEPAKAYSTGMTIKNNETGPIQFGIASVKGKEVSDSIDVKLTPIDSSYVIENNVPITADGQKVKLGIKGTFITSGGSGEQEVYFDPEALPWMTCHVGYGKSFQYSYFMEYSMIHTGPEKRFGFDIIYQFALPKKDVGAVVEQAGGA